METLVQLVAIAAGLSVTARNTAELIRLWRHRNKRDE